jgi:Transglutaminase-like superfamily
MREIRKFLALSLSDKLLLVRVLPIVAVTRLALTLFPKRMSRGLMLRHPSRTRPPSRSEMVRVGWAVRNAARVVPQASCLTQALAAQWIMSRSNFRSELKIGVTSDGEGRLFAHAWLVTGGWIVVGGTVEEVKQYVELERISARLR